jgi:hypothetical protein
MSPIKFPAMFAMKTLKSLIVAAVLFVIGLAFFALIAWEWQLGFAAGSYGGTTFADAPGLAAFILVMQAAIGIITMMSAVAQFQREPDKDQRDHEGDPVTGLFQAIHALVAGAVGCLVAAIGIWAAWDLARMVFHLIATGMDDLPSRLIVGFSLCASTGVFIYLLFSMLIQPVYQYWSPRVRAALLFLRNRRRPLP